MKLIKNIKIAIYTILILFLNLYTFGQEINVVANGVLKKGIEAIVTGNYVRVRTGPSLHHHVITKVNKGTVVLILERDNKLTKIDKFTNYWYRVKIKSSGKEGWIYGAFLKVKTSPKKSETVTFKVNKSEKSPLNPTKDYVGLIKLGEIKSPVYSNLITYGDLNLDGKNEIIIVQPLSNNNRNSHYSIVGYELGNNSYNEIYRLPISSRKIKNITLINKKAIPFPILVITDDKTSQLYTYDLKRKTLRTIYRLNSEHVAIAKGNDNSFFLVYTFKNPTIDYDGTVTYYLTATPIKIKGGRFSTTGTKIKYHRPLPIKKLIAYDLNKDGNDEVIIEIGGQNHGGGIVVISEDNESLKQIINTGILTYNGMPFMKMWGTNFKNNPALAIYSTNPGNSGDVNTEFGLLLFSFTTKTLVTEGFYKVNKLLDDINNYRNIVPLPQDENNNIFLIVDYDRSNRRYIINKPVF